MREMFYSDLENENSAGFLGSVCVFLIFTKLFCVQFGNCGSGCFLIQFYEPVLYLAVNFIS